MAAAVLTTLLGSMACRPTEPPPGVRLVVPGWGRLASPAPGGMTWFRLEGQRGGDSTPTDFGLFGSGVFRGPAPDSTLLLVKDIPGRGLWDSLVVLRSGLAPRWERMATGSTVVHLAYDGPRIRRSEWRGEIMLGVDTVTFATRVFAFNQLDVLLQSLPLGTRDTLILPLYSEGTGQLEYDTVTVSPAREHGSRRSWTLRFADPAIVLSVTVAEDGAEFEDYQVIQRKSGMTIRRMPAPPPQ